MYHVCRIINILIYSLLIYANMPSKVFRHGDRTPDVVYPKFPYTSKDYLPPGVGELTNVSFI